MKEITVALIESVVAFNRVLSELVQRRFGTDPCCLLLLTVDFYGLPMPVFCMEWDRSSLQWLPMTLFKSMGFGHQGPQLGLAATIIFRVLQLLFSYNRAHIIAGRACCSKPRCLSHWSWGGQGLVHDNPVVTAQGHSLDGKVNDVTPCGKVRTVKSCEVFTVQRGIKIDAWDRSPETGAGTKYARTVNENQ